MRHSAFPFTAIVGQDEMKLCLLLNVIDPRIGGVMVMGHRGTGKSTTVRALADVLPEIKRVAGDVYNRETMDGQILDSGFLNSDKSKVRKSCLRKYQFQSLICLWVQPKTVCAGRLILRRR